MGEKSHIEELIERAPVVAFVKDGEGRYRYVNDAWLALFPFTRDDVIGRTDAELFEPEFAREFARNDAQVLQNGEAIEVEERAPVRGNLNVFISTKFPLGQGESRVVGGIAVDISERHAALLALEHSESKFRNLVEHSPEAYVLFDPRRGHFVDANENAARLFGMPIEGLLRASPSALSPVTQPDGTLSEVEASRRIGQALEGETPVFDWMHQASNGQLLPVRIWLARVETPEGFGVRASMLDMREIDHARDALLQARAELDAIQDALPHLVCVVEPSAQTLLHCNRIYEEYFGSSPASLAWLKETSLLSHAVESGRARGEVTARARNANLVMLDVDVSVYRRNSAGEPTRLLVVSQDVTAQRIAEAQQRQTRRLESLGRLAGGVAHDFNNLLTVILSSAEFLKSAVERDSTALEDLDMLRQAAEQARGLTSQLLAFAKEQGGRARAIVVDTVVQGSAMMLRRLLGEDVKLALSLNADGAKIFMDPGQLEQIIVNLAVNSRDAMPSGGTLTIQSRVVVPLGAALRMIELAITDTGRGMPAEVREKVFEPFFTTKDHGKGTGLGLSTVYGIVKRFGGTIRLESELGEGSCARIQLPIHEGEEHSLEPRAQEWAAGRGIRVFLVEDDAAVRNVTERALLQSGFQVQSADCPEAAIALAAAAKGNVDIIVSDMVMPNMSGLALVDQLEQILGPLPVLFVSGYSSDALEQRGVSRENIDLLAKPFGPADLTRAILQVLERKRS